MDRPNERPEPRPQTISELIIEARQHRKTSYRGLAARAESAGFPIKFQYLNELVKSGPKTWPKNPDTLRALSAMLQVPVRTVVLAFATSLGLDVERPHSKLAEQLPDTTPRLSDDMTQALLDVIRAAAETNEGTNTQSPVEPKNEE